eukprot:UC1_evm2s1795
MPATASVYSFFEAIGLAVAVQAHAIFVAYATAAAAAADQHQSQNGAGGEGVDATSSTTTSTTTLTKTASAVAANNPLVVIFSGKRKSGKDYVTDMLVDRLGGLAQIMRVSRPLKAEYAKVNCNLPYP